MILFIDAQKRFQSCDKKNFKCTPEKLRKLVNTGPKKSSANFNRKKEITEIKSHQHNFTYYLVRTKMLTQLR